MQWNRFGWVRSLSVVLAGLAIVTLVIVLLPTSLWMRSATEASLLNDSVQVLSRLNAEWCNRLSERFDTAEGSISRFSEALSAMPLEHPEELASRFDLLVHKDDDGAWRSLREQFSSEHEAGVWLQSNHPLSDEQKAFFIAAKEVTATFGKGALGAFVDTWVLPRQGGIIIYWPAEPEWIYGANADLDYTDTEWVTLTKPDENPEGLPRWTPTSFDPAPKVWMICVVAPFLREGEWGGSVGHDLPLESLIDQIDEIRVYPNTDYLLARSDGVLLVSNQFQNRILESDGRFSIRETGDSELIERFESLNSGKRGSQAFLHHGGEQVVIVNHIHAPNWYVITQTPKRELIEAVRNTYGRMWWAIVLFLLLFTLIVPWVVGRLIVPPVRRLVNGTRKVAEGDLEHSFGKEWLSEFHSISRSIAAMVATLRSALNQAREAEASARRSENQFKGLVSSIPGGVYRCAMDRDWTMTYLSDEIERLTGFPPADFINNARLRFGSLIHPDDQNAVWEQISACVERNEPFTIEYRIMHRDGSTRTMFEKGRGTKGLDGETLWLDGVIFDVTDVKRAEEALRQSNSRYRTFFEYGPDGVVILDPETARFVEFNDRACHQLGYSREEFAALSLSDIDLAEDPEAAAAHIQKILRDGHDDFEAQHRTKQGDVLDVHVTVQVIESEGRKWFHCVWRDITERKRAETELRHSEARFRALVENATEAIVVHDIERNTWVDFNENACRLFQFTPEELATKGPVDLSPPVQPDGRPSRESAREKIEMTLAGASPRFEWIHRNSRGEDFPCEVNLTRLPSSDRVLIRASIVDITERKHAERERARLQDQLTQAQKMESVGRLAGGVAHDFNNMLGVILGHAEVALSKIDTTHPLHSDLEEILRAANRSADLTRQLLTFARRQTVAPKVLDLNETVDGMLKMLKRLIGENIELAWKPADNLWPVRFDSSQIDQILANLCVNAKDAISDTGTITIETENCAFDEQYCSDHPGFVVGEYVRLAVSDNGCGMDKETQAHIFEPFYTTKGPHHGTGLGLASVYGAIKQCDGFINVYSEPEVGTTFTIYFPRVEGEVERPRVDSPIAQPVSGSETVLVVEDEPALLGLATRVLKSLKYDVLGAATPNEAIRIAEQHPGEIHLLMTDVIMPEMNGRDLVDRILALRPSIRCLFMSGYTADAIAHQGVLDDGVNFIQKPFSRTKLAESVREALRDT